MTRRQTSNFDLERKLLIDFDLMEDCQLESLAFERPDLDKSSPEFPLFSYAASVIINY